MKKNFLQLKGNFPKFPFIIQREQIYISKKYSGYEICIFLLRVNKPREYSQY